LRLYRIESEDALVEYEHHDFDAEHHEKVLHKWLQNSPHVLLDSERLLVIGSEARTKMGSYIDLLALDKNGNTVVLELKRGKPDREVVAQVLSYASYVEGMSPEDLEEIFKGAIQEEGPSLVDAHKAYFNLDREGMTVTLNRSQRIVIVAKEISSELLQMVTYLRKKGIYMECAVFNYFKTKSGEELLSTDVVIGGPPNEDQIVTTKKKGRTNKKAFMESVDEFGRPVFDALLHMAESEGLRVSWGGVGFTLNAMVDGKSVGLCYAYPPSSAWHQTFQTFFSAIRSKTSDADRIIKSYREELLATGLFGVSSNGVDLHLRIDHRIDNASIEKFVEIIRNLSRSVAKQRLVEKMRV
jgi:hypothetical protein